MRKEASLHRDPIKGIVVVHGVGSARQSSGLMYIGQPLLDWVQRWMRANHPEKRVRFEDARLAFRRTDNDEARPPSHVTLRVEDDASGMDYEELHWIVAEVWWSTDSRGPDVWNIFKWLFKYLGVVLVSLVIGVCREILKLVEWQTEFTIPGASEKKSRQPFRAVIEWVWQPFRVAIEWVKQFPWKFIDLLNAGLQLVAFVLIVFVCAVPVCVLVLLTQIPIGFIQQFVLVYLLRTWVTANVGEMYTLLEDEIQAANIRGRLEQTIEWLVTKGNCEDIYVIAHSGGAVVGFETLCQHADRPDLVRHVKKFLTVGAGLNKAWLLKPDQWRLKDSFTASIRWVDFWSAYDIVPAGSLTGSLNKGELWHKLVESLKGATVDEKLGKPEEVINWMSMVSDHTGYWTNEEQILSRLAQEIDETDYKTSPFWPGDKRQSKVVTDRMHRISIRAGARLLAALLCGAAILNHRAQLPGWAGTAWYYIQAAPIISGPIGAIEWLFARLPTPIHQVALDVVGTIWVIACGIVGLGIGSFILYLPIRLGILNHWDKRAYEEAVQPKPAYQKALTYFFIWLALFIWLTLHALVAFEAGKAVLPILGVPTFVTFLALGVGVRLKFGGKTPTTAAASSPPQ